MRSPRSIRTAGRPAITSIRNGASGEGAIPGLEVVLVVRSRCAVLKAIVMPLVFGMYVVYTFDCMLFGPVLDDELCVRFKRSPSGCRIGVPILASLLVRLVVLLPFRRVRLAP